MSKMIQIRNVPADVHGRLKAKAALRGQSLSEYLLAVIERNADQPTAEEMSQRLRSRERVSVGLRAVKDIRDIRDAS